MATENWLDIILPGVGVVNGSPTGVVPVFQADSNLTAVLTGKIEAGLIDPVVDQVISSGDASPAVSGGVGSYCSLSIPRFDDDEGGGHSGSPVGTVTFPVLVRAALVVVGYPQLACESRMRTILGQMAVTVGQNWRATPFGISSPLGLTTRVKVGGGMMEPATSHNSVAFVVYGAYHFTLYYRLKIVP